jgi:DNA primase
MEGKEALVSVVEGAKPCFSYLMEKATSRFRGTTADGKEGIRDFMFPFIAALGSQVRAEDYIKALSEEIDSSEDAVRSDFLRWRKGPRTGAEQNMARPESAMSSDLFVLLAVTARRDLFPAIRNSGITLEDIEDASARELFIALEEAFRAEDDSFPSLLQRVEDPRLQELLVSKMASGEFDLNQEKMVSDGVRLIKQRILRKKRDQLGLEMRRMEDEKADMAAMRTLLEEKMHLDEELAKLAVKTP